jgi:acyl-coenzyme A thioesterase PaaI-like protein
MEPADGDAILRDNFAPWVQDLARGGFVPMTTVQLSATFQRAVAGKDVLVTARVTKLGRTTAFADITMTAGDAIAAHATTVYALLG